MSGKQKQSPKASEQRLPAAADATRPGSLTVIDPAAAVSPAMAPKWLTPQSMEAALNLADMMAKAKLVPEHLRGSPGDCLLVVSQAARWGIDPFAVAQATAIVRGKLCYEGKLVATVLRATGAIEGRLDYVFEGAVGPGMSVTVTGTPRGGTPKSLRGTVAQWKTDNGNWEKDPQSMLVYRGTRQWARLFAPEAMLGVITPDEIEEIKDAVVIGGSPGVHPTQHAADQAAPPRQQVTQPTGAAAPGQSSAPAAPSAATAAAAPATLEADLTAEYGKLQSLGDKGTAAKFWRFWADKAVRLDAIRRANHALKAITERLPGTYERLLRDILLDRENPDDVLGILADLEKAVPAPAKPSAPQAAAADDKPPY